jgi:hypothetical protein
LSRQRAQSDASLGEQIVNASRATALPLTVSAVRDKQALAALEGI